MTHLDLSHFSAWMEKTACLQHPHFCTCRTQRFQDFTSKSPRSVAALCEFGTVQFWWIQKSRVHRSKKSVIKHGLSVTRSRVAMFLVKNLESSSCAQQIYVKKPPNLVSQKGSSGLALWYAAQFVNQNVAVCYDRGSKYTRAKLDGWNTKPDETKSAYVTSFWFLNVEPYKADLYQL